MKLSPYVQKQIPPLTHTHRDESLKPNCAFFIKLLLVQCLAIGCVSQSFDFFYLNFFLDFTTLNLYCSGLDNTVTQNNLSSISDAIKGATRYDPRIECNVVASDNSQLCQIYLCRHLWVTTHQMSYATKRGKCIQQ
ncbi:hypothetical protein CFP56_039479 [Quercus suber]|uniref:Uncharacterized protein n=1 Tax=Quercus suber TaxID=58331 RepID=A0AAW0J064_QUESU